LRRFDLANRNRQKADLQFEFAASKYLTISPNFGMRWDDYPESTLNQLGVRSNHSWNAGVEIGAAISPRLKLMASYNYEDTRLRIAGGNGAAAGCPADLTNVFNPVECSWSSAVHQRYHTLTAAANIKVIPEKLDLRLEAVYSRSAEGSRLTPCAAGVGCNGLQGLDPAQENFGQMSTSVSSFRKFNATAKYYVDPDFVRQMGWNGDIVIKAKYTWVQNSASGYAYSNMTPYQPTADSQLEGGGRSLFLAGYNPNYSTHVAAVSVQLKW
jgi:hypothetical protein